MAVQGADMRQRILEEAARLFVAHGYHGISMREIAAAVGLSKAGLYYHFQDKEHLLLALLTDHLDRVEGVLMAAQQQEGDTRSRVRAMLRGIFDLSPEQRSVIRLASQEVAQLGPAARAEFSQLYYRQFIARIEAILQAGIERGDLRQVDVHLATWLLLGMAYPFFYPTSAAQLDGPGPMIDLMVETFFDGLAAQPPKP